MLIFNFTAKILCMVKWGVGSFVTFAYSVIIRLGIKNSLLVGYLDKSLLLDSSSSKFNHFLHRLISTKVNFDLFQVWR